MAKKTGKDLVIVESPAKAKTINKYLGDGFVVKASMGHVRDLPPKGMGVDLKTFVPEYEILQSRGKVINELKKLAKDSDHIYLATDLDRENAQQARRILDRIVGYEISPLLWRKVAKGLSAGRVQSVAVRLVVEREREIEAFVPQEHWKIAGVFTAKSNASDCKKLAAAWHEFLTNTGNGERTKIERER